MTTIRDILSRDLSRPIEEVIKVDQQDEETVYSEIREYVATDRIKRQYLDVLGAIADAPGDPTEGIGVWVSGFFGSGKSSFAKNLGYILANHPLKGVNASDLFVRQLEEQAPGDAQVRQIRDRINYINHRFEAKVIMFDVQVDRAVRQATEPIAEIMYTVLLRELDYAEDYDIAELEIELEGEKRLGDFVKSCAQLYENGTEGTAVPVTLPGVSEAEYAIWRRVRKGAQRIQRASAALNRMNPTTYPSPDSWAASLQKKETDITIRTLVDRTFTLTQRRRPGHAVIYIIDEVGQYVARSAEKIENLRAVAEHFGQEGKNRVLAGQTPAPAWVIVTSQEKLDEVVAAIDDKRVELAKLQDRFKTRIDMAPADIREVATKRVLAKKAEAESRLAALFAQNGAILKTHTHLERTSRQHEITAVEFTQFYPYLPHFIDISIDIVSGIRLHAGGPRHIGGSNRTIIKQTYEMLVSDRTRLADAPLGTLVSLDRIYELVEGNLPSEKRKDITTIMERWADDPWPARTAKAITLLEYVRDLPRSEGNLAALLYDRMGAESPLAEVQRAVELLEAAQFITQTENGWKLLTAQEKNWSAERNAFNPNPREQHDILEDRLKVIFAAPALTRYRYLNLHNFRVGVTWERRSITGQAQVPLQLRMADGPDLFQSVGNMARDDSRAKTHENEIFWVASLTTEIDELVRELFRSQQMVGRYNQLRAQAKITTEESASLAAEKNQVLRFEERLKDRLEATLANGRGFFRGVAKDGGNLGKQLPEILKGMFDYAVPDLYPKLEMGARPLKGNEAEEILKAANLNGLSKIFYGPPDGLDLVVKEGSKFVVNPNAPIAKEVGDYLKREHAYGNKVTGKTLEAHFGGLGYGWQQEMLWLVLATQLRGGGLEVTYQGRRYRNHLDPQARIPFGGTNAFRAASFAPRQAIDLTALVTAVKRYEALTGDEVDVEETAIAQAFQSLARVELEQLLPVEARVKAHHIPVLDTLQEYRNMLDAALNSASDDAVVMLVGEGVSFQGLRDRVATIRKATDEKGLARLQRMRTAVNQIWPLLQEELANTDEGVQLSQQQVNLLQEALDTVTYYETGPAIEAALRQLEEGYKQVYQTRHQQRQAAYQAAVEAVKAQPDWAKVPAEMSEATLKPLTDRAEHELILPDGVLVCQRCQASLKELVLDVTAVNHVRSQVLLRVQELVAPEEVIQRVKWAEVVGVNPTLSTHEEVDEMLDQLGNHLHKLVDADVKIILE